MRFARRPRLPQLSPLLLVGLVALSVTGAGCAPPRPPNVLVIVMDTTRADRCSVNGYERPTTPSLEALGREGVVYENAWSPAGWTGPAHASLFTGLRPENHGFHRSNRHYLLPDSRTLAEAFRDAGYRTAAFSNNPAICNDGLEQGFETCVPMYEDEGRPYPWAPATHERALDWVRNGTGAAADGGGGADRPFFLFVNDMEPHVQYTPPLDLQARFVPPGADPVAIRLGRGTDATQMFAHNAWSMRIPEGGLRMLSDLYDAEIASLDRDVGRLIDGLRSAGLLDGTIVVVTSDHGENLGDHGLVDHMFSIHGSIRHVPLVVRWPARFAAGRRIPDVVRLEDLYPTLLELCGLEPSGELDGRSLLGDVSGRVSYGLVDAPDALLDRRLRQSGSAFDAEPLRVGYRAVFDGRYHLIRDSRGGEQLFDHRADPREASDIASFAAEPLGRMRLLLDSAYPDSH